MTRYLFCSSNKYRLIFFIVLLLAHTSFFMEQTNAQSAIENQESKLHQLSVQNGMPSQRTMNLVQDGQGFIWMATHGGGLARFDGKKVRLFVHKQDDLTTIANNNVYNMVIDSQDRLWLFYFTGQFDVFDTKTGQVWHLSTALNFKQQADKINNVHKGDFIYNLIKSSFEDHQHNMWLVTYGFVAKVNLLDTANV